MHSQMTEKTKTAQCGTCRKIAALALCGALACFLLLAELTLVVLNHRGTTTTFYNGPVALEHLVFPADYSTVIPVRSENCYAWDSDFGSLSSHATLVVDGTVSRIEYTTYEGNPWTKVDLVVNVTIDGSAQPGDIVSVFIQEGYIPLWELVKWESSQGGSKFDYEDMDIDCCLIEERVDGDDPPQVGDRSVFFLMEQTVNSDWAGGYERVRGPESELDYVGDGMFAYEGTGNKTSARSFVDINEIARVTNGRDLKVK